MSVFDIERLTHWINVNNGLLYMLKYKHIIKYDCDLNKLTLPIYHINKEEFYIDANIIYHLYDVTKNDHALHGITNYLSHLCMNVNSYNPMKPYEYMQKRYNIIKDGEYLVYIPLTKAFISYLTSNKPMDYSTCRNLYNDKNDTTINHILSLYNCITPHFIDLKNDENINKINRRLNNLELSNLELQNENKLLKEKIRTNEIELHYLKSTNKEKKIKYNYEEIKNKNKELNKEFKRVYKLISNNVGFNLMS